MENLSQQLLSTGIKGPGDARRLTIPKAATVALSRPEGFRARIATAPQCKVATTDNQENKALSYMTGIIAKDLNKFGKVYENTAIKNVTHANFKDWATKTTT